jgi:hypothetical protein
VPSEERFPALGQWGGQVLQVDATDALKALLDSFATCHQNGGVLAHERPQPGAWRKQPNAPQDGTSLRNCRERLNIRNSLTA